MEESGDIQTYYTSLSDKYKDLFELAEDRAYDEYLESSMEVGAFFLTFFSHFFFSLFFQV